jgi:glycine oxidase
MTSSDFLDVVVVGDGLVGLACARAASARGLRTALVGRRRPGVASIAAAGFLAPTVDPARGAALAFALDARASYPDFLVRLQEETRHAVPFALEGVLRVPATEREAESMQRAQDPFSRWLSPQDVRAIEPALAAPWGARLHDGDGMVDNVRLVQALEEAVALGGIERYATDATRLQPVDPIVAVALQEGPRLRARQVVVAAGAWASGIPGLPRALAVRPLRGQMMSLRGDLVQRPVFGHGGYLVPRPHEQLVIAGSTSEAVGFAVGTTDEALNAFRRTAAALVPSLARADEVRTWSGLRPMTLDGLPIIGRDPDVPRIVYAAGHSRNGILLAPLTGEAVADLLTESAPSHDLSPFRPERFGGSTGVSA